MDNTNILYISLISLLVIIIIVLLVLYLQPKHHYRFYLPSKPKQEQKETFLPSLYVDYEKQCTNNKDKLFDFGGCRMGTRPYTTDHSKKNLPENKNLPTIINNCLSTFSEDQQNIIKKACPDIIIKPTPSNNRSDVWCCPSNIESLISIKHNTKSLGGCGYNSTPANLTYKKYGICMNKAQKCAPNWEQAKNPDGSLQYDNDNAQKCCVIQEGKEREVISNLADLCSTFT